MGDTIALRIGLTDREDVLAMPAQAIGWGVASDAANDAQDRDVVVDRAVATLYAARARAEALELNRQGKFDAARARLERTARRILASAGDDAELKALAEELLADATQHEGVHVVSCLRGVGRPDLEWASRGLSAGDEC